MSAVDWQAKARCAGVDEQVFFPDLGGGAGRLYQIAKGICAECVVRAQCLEFAMKIERSGSGEGRYGIYGGLTPRERMALAGERERYRRNHRNQHSKESA